MRTSPAPLRARFDELVGRETARLRAGHPLRHWYRLGRLRGALGEVMTIDDDEDATPVEVKGSGQHRMGDVPCPKCKGTTLPCTLCKGRREVSLSVAVAWNVEHGE